MGFFSWKYCDNKKDRMICGKRRNSYLLIPQAYGGGHIVEPCYDGYGHLGGHDVFEEVAKWNRGLITAGFLTEPDRNNYAAGELGDWYFEKAKARFLRESELLKHYADGMDEEFMIRTYGDEWLRTVGILLVCYDEENAKLTYPIKIAIDKDAVYEECGPSLSDPLQGCY